MSPEIREEAGAGLRLLTDSAPDVASSGEHLTRRFLYPEPRVNEARLLGELATAMIDISDGLHVDLLKMLDASQVGGDLDTRSVRLSNELQACCGADEALELALTGGDDYELCFTVPQEKEGRLAELCEQIECPVARIGETSEELGVRWINQHGPYNVKTSSFRHFG